MVMLTSEQERQMLDALRECVVVVRAGGSTGTGFFIDAGRVLTCRHLVVSATLGASPISVTYGPGVAPHGREELEAFLRDDSPSGWPDVAVLDVPGAADSRCVVIDSHPVSRGTPLLSAGYPAMAAWAYQVQRFIAGAAGSGLEGNPVLSIEGDVASPGMSGSPVVNLQSGLICGILGIRKDGTATLAGTVALFADFIGQFPYLVMLNDQPPEAARGWLRILGATPLESAEHSHDASARRGEPALSASAGTGLAPETRVSDNRNRGFNGQPVKLFISYSHRDERYLKRLETQLAALRREGVIADWHDRMIMPGEQWRMAIGHGLESADCVLLLVTPDFIASDYCYAVEMERALQRHREGRALVLPVIVRPSDWQHTPLGELQALPKDAKPVVEWARQDRAWLDVTDGLRRALVGLSQ